jgi:deoxyribodipyrimidine photo-lyase
MIDDLRIHAHGERGPRAGGDHVLYWMQSTLRAHDSHALTFAIEQANLLRLPVLVYQGLRHDYPWASDRLHTFILESAADLHDAFAEQGIQYALHLERYAEERGDPNADATSGLSPYLHFGNISPREVLFHAREAVGVLQFAKFKDEILTWRELAFNFTHFNPRHRTVEAIPPWARTELDRGEADQRPVLYSLEELEQARTGEPLWNAAQRAYLRDGWMPNALRMLWGKAVVQWTRTAADALAILEHLNNKYALDGRDPSTYLNLLWVLGKFDRPFYRRPIFGTVRSMSLRAAEKKFDVGRIVARYA